MSTQSTIDSVERLLDRKQIIPSKMIRDLLTDCKALRILANQQSKEIERLKAQPEPEKAGEK